MIIDPTTALGKLRLRVGDHSDFPLLPDSVYIATLEDNGQNVAASTRTVAQYILGILTQKTHKKLNQLEVWGSEAFAQYLAFIKLTILNPSLSDTCPIPYTSSSATVTHPLIQLQSDWENSWAAGTENDMLHNEAVGVTSETASWLY